MTKINHITKLTNKATKNVTFQVYYEGGKRWTYTHEDNLPMTVVNFLLNQECETVYTETGKIERFH